VWPPISTWINRGSIFPHEINERIDKGTRSHDLVLSQLPIDVLHELQMGVTQAMNSRTKKALSELIKAMVNNFTLDI